MCKNFTLCLLMASLFFSCAKNEPDQKTTAAHTTADSTTAAAEKLRASALSETDLYGRVQASLVKLQDEYAKSAGKVKGQGKVSVFVDEHFTLLLKNETGKDVMETKVNLKDLNSEQGGMTLLPDRSPGEFPGLRIFVLEGRPGVEISKNGKKEKEEKQLDIYMATRAGIERITPAFLQAIRVAQGHLE